MARSYASVMLSVSVLGPIAVVRDGVAVTVPGGKTSELLVRLALEAGDVVRTDRIVDDLWGAGAINTQRNTLQSKVTKLRRALGEPSVVISTDGGYLLAVEPSDVDALSVASDVATASGLLVDDAHRAADLCASALTRFVADVLPAAGDAEWVAPHRARLAEARMTLVETQFAARLRMGHVADSIGELDVAVAAHPYREGLWELLITALYRVGRQAEALATYQRVRKLLADELGLDPGPQLQQLEQQILVQDASLLTADGTIRPFDDTPAGNLPSIAGDLIGRATEIDAVTELLTAQRLVEIVGPGGVGKTALAIAIGRQLSVTDDVTSGGVRASGGAWLARLETAVTAHDVIDTLVAALNVGGEAALFERLRASTALVILDNCEHVLDAAADLAVRLLDAAPALRILCTSQVPLGVDGEAHYELAPLALPEAVELFTRRASAQRSSRTTNDANDATRDLCRSLDGLPLAIELAAARTRTLSIEEITRRLDDRFTVLSDPTSRRSARRRELKSTIRWSYDLLFPDDQRGLWALAPFAGRSTARRGRVRPRRARRTVHSGHRRRRPPRQPIAPHRRRRWLVEPGSLSAARQHPRVRARGDERRGALRTRSHRARHLVRRGRRSLYGGRAEQPAGRAPRLRAGGTGQHRCRTGVEHAARPAARAGHRQRVRVGLGRARRQPRRTSDPRGPRRLRRPRPRARPSQRAAARGVDRSLDRSARPRSRAHRGGRATGERHRRRRTASPRLLLPRVRGLARRPVRPSTRADRSQQRALRGLDRPWDQAANWIFAARVRPSPPATTNAVSRHSTRSPTGSSASMTPGSRSVTRLSVASWPASSIASTMPSCTSVGRRRRHDASASARPRRTRWPASAGLSARPATTPPAQPPSSSPSPRPKPPVMCAWPRWPGVHLGQRPARTRAEGRGASRPRGSGRMASRRRRRGASCPRRVPPRRARRGGRCAGCGGTACHCPRRSAAGRCRPRRGLRPGCAGPSRPGCRRRRPGHAALRRSGPTDGVGVPLHHRTGSNRRPRRQAARLTQPNDWGM